MDLVIKLFDHTIVPILTYSSEVWGFEKIDIIKRIHQKFLRNVLKLKKSTPWYMVNAELGRLPLQIIIKTRMIVYWNKLIVGKENKLSFKLYQFMLNIPIFQSKWITQIKNILTETGRLDLWYNQHNIQGLDIKHIIKQALIDQYYQNWNHALHNSSKGATNYSIYKTSICFEKYFNLLNKKYFLQLVKFRTGSHYLPVEVGRWENIDISERKCYLCNKNDIGDEMHYLLICPFFCTRQKKIC